MVKEEGDRFGPPFPLGLVLPAAAAGFLFLGWFAFLRALRLALLVLPRGRVRARASLNSCGRPGLLGNDFAVLLLGSALRRLCGRGRFAAFRQNRSRLFCFWRRCVGHRCGVFGRIKVGLAAVVLARCFGCRSHRGSCRGAAGLWTGLSQAIGIGRAAGAICGVLRRPLRILLLHA